MIFVQNVERLCKIGPGKGPAPQYLLRLLINVYDYNSGVRLSGLKWPVAKPRIERVQLKPLSKFGDRSSDFLYKDEVVDDEGDDRNAKTEDERDAVTPPGEQEFVDAEAAAAFPPAG